MLLQLHIRSGRIPHHKLHIAMAKLWCTADVQLFEQQLKRAAVPALLQYLRKEELGKCWLACDTPTVVD